jgi:hypothetical protein
MSGQTQQRRFTLPAAVLVLGFSACDTPPTVSAPLPVPPAGRSMVLSEDYPVYPSERPLVEIARSVPGFGGLAVDESGVLVAYLTDISQADAVRFVIEPYRLNAVANGAVEDAVVVVRQARFEFLDLLYWRDLITVPVLSVPGVSMLDLAEQYNRLLVGTYDDHARIEVADLLRYAGIPEDAVLFEAVGRIRTDATTTVQQQWTLQDAVAPIVGGLQFNYFTASGQYPDVPCTIGFVATWNGQRVWVTNSHCTEVTRAVTTSTTYWQPHWDWGLYTELGTELADPLGSICGVGKFCRGADAAVVSFHHGVPNSLGYAARPVGPPGQGWAGNIEIEEVEGFRITSDDEEVGIFWGVEKVGRTTGWTYGQVLNTCIHYPTDENTNFILTCQHRADYVRASGDSGAPVFSRLGQQSTDVRLFGIHNASDAEGYALFSPVSGVRADLGPLSMLPPDAPPPPPPPPLNVGISGPAGDLVRPYAQCLYTALAAGGSPPYTYAWYLNKSLLETGQFLYHTSGASNFSLQVIVPDAANATGSSVIHMVIDPSAPECLDS